ncbi:MAG: protein kinase [Myxococcota bacterium]
MRPTTGQHALVLPPVAGIGLRTPNNGMTPAAPALSEAPPDQTLADRIGLPGLATPVALLSLPGDRPFNPLAARPLGRYRVGVPRGEGGMGEVRAARENDLGRVVAMKTLRGELRGQEAFIRALVFEARLTGQLEHPNIVPVYDIGTLPDGTPYYTMKLVGELSLKDVLRQLREDLPLARRHYTLPRLLQYFRGICMAVEYAHARGVIHRDLKPENVLIGDYGEVQILDWGVARVLAHEGRPSYFAGRVEEPGVVIGTPHYMAPEQARGDTHLVDARADLYARGVILYQVLTHTLPHAKSTTTEQLDALLSEPVIAPSERAPDKDVPPELERICMKALQPARADRYASVRALWDDIEAFLEGEKERQRLQALADEQAAHGDEAATRYYQAAAELLVLEDEVKKDDLATRHIDPLPLRRAAWERKLQAEERRMQAARVFAEAVLGYQQALAHEPRHAHARGELARLYRARARDARLRGDMAEVILYSDLGRALEPPRPGAYGTLHVRTYPEGAWVRIVELAKDRVAAEGVAPMVVRLDPGSYIVAATLAGHAERRTSAVIEDGQSDQVLISLVSWDAALPIVARGDDLTAMKEAFSTVVSERRLGSVMITGEAGLGKRKLLDEFGGWLDRLPETVIYGAVRLDKVTATVPLHAITELTIHRAGISRNDPPELRAAKVHDAVHRAWEMAGARAGARQPEADEDLDGIAQRILQLPGLRPADAPAPSGPDDALAVFDAVARWLKKQAEVSPIVLALRGADHLDRLTRDLLFVVAERLQDVPVLCLFFGREDQLQLRADQTLRLRPLEREHIRHQLVLLLRGTVTDEVLAVVEAKSQGNAFLVSELVRLLLADGQLRHDGRQWRLVDAAKLGDRSLLDLLVAQLDRLTPSARQVLVRASVAGTTFWAGELERALGRSLDADLDELLRSEVIGQRASSRFASSRELGFRHDSLQRRLYRDQPEAERALAHRQIAAWMEAELAARMSDNDVRPLGDLALAAHHWLLGGDPARASALRDELAREAARWERPDAPDWFAWPADLTSGLLDWS